MANRRPDAFFWILAAALVVGAAAWLRFSDLGHKIIHADEAVQGWKTGLLLDGEGYTYDPGDHHGPTLYFLAAPLARLLGENTLEELTAATLRVLPALAGLGVVGITVGFGFLLGRRAVLLAALFSAVSPMLVFYSRHFVQEMLLVLFSAGFLLCLWRWLLGPSRVWVSGAGICLGLMIATKETWLIVAGATVGGLVVAAGPDQQLRSRILARGNLPHALGAAALALLVAAAFYTSGFTNPGALADVWHGLLTGSQRAGGGGHGKPWYYYMETLAWTHRRGFTYTELTVVALALASAPLMWRKDSDSRTIACGVRFFWGFSASMALVYFIIPYKTIWLLCGAMHGLAILTGLGAEQLLARARGHLLHAIACVAVVAIAAHYGWQARRASTVDANRTWNPYAYVETSPDILRLPGRIDAIRTAYSLTGHVGDPVIKVAMPNFWPIPWLLRGRPNIGYWTTPDFDHAADVLIEAADWYEENGLPAEDDPGVEIFGVRDGDLAVMAVKRELWEKSLEVTP